MYNVCMYGYCFNINFRSTSVYLYDFFHAYADSPSLDAIGPWKSFPGDRYIVWQTFKQVWVLTSEHVRETVAFCGIFPFLLV